ncbi:hypothetical protein MARPO_0003s0205 [Marchantia polymorpha]|uniref:Uncharacterized protein n=1 Tax=Marchantia polymorpha TaxID=3197 RepID=A0A2R6XT91_MARPO|nr:hypothetical protein MARPO_0003s0205 [Marchantia polymorpha]|eukprot:PTQ49332.1 hypothetical protein MARPO_0003s0205 [Marchantia polymorpha]
MPIIAIGQSRFVQSRGKPAKPEACVPRPKGSQPPLNRSALPTSAPSTPSPPGSRWPCPLPLTLTRTTRYQIPRVPRLYRPFIPPRGPPPPPSSPSPVPIEMLIALIPPSLPLPLPLPLPQAPRLPWPGFLRFLVRGLGAWRERLRLACHETGQCREREGEREREVGGVGEGAAASGTRGLRRRIQTAWQRRYFNGPACDGPRHGLEARSEAWDIFLAVCID